MQDSLTVCALVYTLYPCTHMPVPKLDNVCVCVYVCVCILGIVECTCTSYSFRCVVWKSTYLVTTLSFSIRCVIYGTYMYNVYTYRW